MLNVENGRLECHTDIEWQNEQIKKLIMVQSPASCPSVTGDMVHGPLVNCADTEVLFDS